MTACELDWSALGSWAQAVFTFIAIFASAKLQDRSIQKRAEADQLNRRKSGEALLDVGYRQLITVSQHLHGQGGRERMLNNSLLSLLREDVRMMQSFPIHEIGNPDAMAAFAEATGSMVLIANAVDQSTYKFRAASSDEERDGNLADVRNEVDQVKTSYEKRYLTYRQELNLSRPGEVR